MNNCCTINKKTNTLPFFRTRQSQYFTILLFFGPNKVIFSIWPIWADVHEPSVSPLRVVHRAARKNRTLRAQWEGLPPSVSTVYELTPSAPLAAFFCRAVHLQT